jgi:CDP-diacylglycerol--glycerol-3-phosphate 3-phosphatidyltransferase
MAETSDAVGKPEDFLRLRRAGAVPGVGYVVGSAVGRLRDAAAAALALRRVRPGALTWGGLILALGAGACLAVGAGHGAPWAARAEVRSWWPVVGALLLLCSGAMDLLDGPLARAGRRETCVGALLDSTLDRCSDGAVFLGCAVHFAAAGNATLVLLSGLAIGGSLLVSYVKARAETMIESCGAGYWQRGERVLLFAAAVLCGHVPAGLWLLGLGPWLTVRRRLRDAAAVLAGRPPRAAGALAKRLFLWRHPRGSLGYDLWTLALVAFVLVAPALWPGFAGADPLGAVLR